MSRQGGATPRKRKSNSPFCYFNSSPEIIRVAVRMYARYPLSLRNVEDLIAESGVDICHETVRHWWIRFGPLFAADFRRHGSPETMTTDGLRSYKAAMTNFGNADKQKVGRWANN